MLSVSGLDVSIGVVPIDVREVRLGIAADVCLVVGERARAGGQPHLPTITAPSAISAEHSSIAHRSWRLRACPPVPPADGTGAPWLSARNLCNA